MSLLLHVQGNAKHVAHHLVFQFIYSYLNSLIPDISDKLLLIIKFHLPVHRVRVTVSGEFLHFIYPFQFLDSPEWDSLRPSEESVFQVNSTLQACACFKNCNASQYCLAFVFMWPLYTSHLITQTSENGFLMLVCWSCSIVTGWPD